jgi:hypothetical protein
MTRQGVIDAIYSSQHATGAKKLAIILMAAIKEKKEREMGMLGGVSESSSVSTQAKLDPVLDYLLRFKFIILESLIQEQGFRTELNSMDSNVDAIGFMFEK